MPVGVLAAVEAVHLVVQDACVFHDERCLAQPEVVGEAEAAEVGELLDGSQGVRRTHG